MSNDLIPVKEEMQVLEVMAKYATESKFFNTLGGLPGIFSIMLYAREIGVPPMQALMSGMHSIQGKITIAPQLMNSMIRKAGHKMEIDSNEQRCIIKGFRKDTGESCTVSFSVEEARKAGIYKDGGGWAKYPSDMCFARALSRLARRLFPDVIGNAYVEGEIEDDDDKKTKTVKAAPKVQEPSIEATATVQVETPSEEELMEKCIAQFSPKEHPDFPIEDFLEYCAKNQKKAIEEVAKQALKNSDRFAEAYRKWADMKEDELVASLKKPDMDEA